MENNWTKSNQSTSEKIETLRLEVQSQNEKNNADEKSIQGLKQDIEKANAKNDKKISNVIRNAVIRFNFIQAK